MAEDLIKRSYAVQADTLEETAEMAGLYAGGDVVCGYEGVVHQTGNCLSVVVHTGRVAGTNAARK